jgi:hypothetical protein
MAFCFRIRFHLGQRVRIGSPETRLLLTTSDDAEEVALQATETDTALKDATSLALRGHGYDNEPRAAAEAERWRGLLQKAFARVNVGADFGDRAAKGYFTKFGLQFLEERTGQRMLNDVHGTLVFECEPPPLFAGTNLTYFKSVQPERLTKALTAAIELGAVMSEGDQLAYDLYSASFSESSADARFALLMMAVETMIVLEPRPPAVREHIEELVAATKHADLTQAQIDSIVGSLSWLSNESISQGGRRLASRLGDRAYMDESPTRFFTECYDLRGKLFHGYAPRPSRSEVDSRAGSLELFVRDLLSIELLDRMPD